MDSPFNDPESKEEKKDNKSTFWIKIALGAYIDLIIGTILLQLYAIPKYYTGAFVQDNKLLPMCLITLVIWEFLAIRDIFADRTKQKLIKILKADAKYWENNCDQWKKLCKDLEISNDKLLNLCERAIKDKEQQVDTAAEEEAKIPGGDIHD